MAQIHVFAQVAEGVPAIDEQDRLPFVTDGCNRLGPAGKTARVIAPSGMNRIKGPPE